MCKSQRRLRGTWERRRPAGISFKVRTERARGGATAIHNEVLLCSTCHSLIHAGHLSVQGNPADGLAWSVSGGESSTEFWARLRELNSVPEVQIIEAVRSGSTAVDLKNPMDPKNLMDPVNSETRSDRFEYLPRALKTLGFPAEQAKRRLEGAWESLGARASETSDEDLVKRALRMHAA